MKVMPWKNGQGVTTEIAIEPVDANVGELTFHWRLSAAEIRQDGPFSNFDGYDRLLVVTSPHGLTLDRNNESISLQPFETFQFRGEDAVFAKRPSGAECVFDIGLIYRRDVVKATLSTLKIPTGAAVMIPLADDFETHFFIGIEGAAEIRNAGKGSLVVDKDGAVRMEKGPVRRGGLGRASVVLTSRASTGDTYVALVALSVRAACERLGRP